MTITTPEWTKHAIFYQIFPDRFARVPQPGDEHLNLEEWDSAPTHFGFKGGNLYGVIEKLDYLEELGINAIYFNPIFSSPANHRYHTFDYYEVDPLLGGDEALRQLIDEAHKREIKIVLDGVFNHASRGFWQFNHTLENGAASPYVDWFHFDQDRLYGKRPWGAYPNADETAALGREDALTAIGYKAWWNLPALPKLNTDNPAVRAFIFDIAEYWIKFGIDGWRLDVPADIDDDSFWEEFRSRVKAINPEAYIVGEIWHESKRWLQGDQFDAVMNYPVTVAELGFFGQEHLDQAEIAKAGGYEGKVRPFTGYEFDQQIDDILSWYDPAITQVQMNLLDSHDTPRALTCLSGDKNSMKLAYLFQFTYPGAPTIYYGDEIGIDGGHDPDCRKSFNWDESAWDKDLRDYTKAVIALRKAHPALRTGSFNAVHVDNDTYAFERVLGGERIVVALNVANEPRTISLAGVANETLFGKADIVHNGEQAEVTVAPRRGVVLRG